MFTNLKDKLTIVIPTYNEDRYIERTILSIVQQNNVKGLRVIVSDGFSTDKTRKNVNNLKEIFKDIINIELIDGGKVARGRNNGAKLVKTKYILFLDGDSPILDANNLTYNVNLMNQKRLHLLTGKVKSVGKDPRTNIGFILFNLLNRIISIKTPFAIGGYFMTRTDKFMEYGMFNETLNNSEDYHLSKQFYVTRKMTYNSFVNIVRHICKSNNIMYTSQMKYNESKYNIDYNVYYNSI